MNTTQKLEGCSLISNNGEVHELEISIDYLLDWNKSDNKINMNISSGNFEIRVIKDGVVKDIYTNDNSDTIRDKYKEVVIEGG